MFYIKKICYNILYKYDEYLSRNPFIKVDYVDSLNNFGDILNPIIVKNIAGDNIDIHRVSSSYYNHTYLMAIGSILQRANRNAIVWGSGFIESKSSIYEKPKKIYSVRGPKTREKLLGMNIECPEVYGDPALLISKYFRPNVDKKYKLGIMPHYVDKNHSWLKKIGENDEVLIINIQNPDPKDVIKQMLSCKIIASSSLHGLIVSDSYKIPNIWIKLSDKIKGGEFKYLDYFATTDKDNKKPLNIRESTNVQELINYSTRSNLIIDKNKLVDSFPELDRIISN